MALTDKLTSIADAIRGKTGKTDEMTLDQMATAIASIETGGGGGGLAYDMGEFVLDTDVKSSTYANGGIPHALGEVPEFVVVWTDDFAELSAENPSTQQANLGYVWLKGLTGLRQRLTSAINSDFGLYIPFCLNANSYVTNAFIPTSTSYCMYADFTPTEKVIFLQTQGSTYYWRAGVTYKYFVSKAWWNVGGVANAK